MTNKAKKFRDQAKKATAKNENAKNKRRASLVKELSREVAPIKRKISYEVERASQEGRRTVRIDAVRLGAGELSQDTATILFQELEKEGFKVGLKMCAIYDMPLGETLPGRHDIEGWEEYEKKRKIDTRRFVSEITISW
ncbi:MAG: hypothetical protein HYT03_02830 [Candidatus Harrisonbacteria bacterium]|nr:hypothetical protein [Candidatus Harrisonbacteria bacterium]